MKQYNRSLDYMTLAMAHGRKGNVEKAAKLFAAAIAAPDALRAVAILEASNKQAFEATAAAKKATAAKRPAVKASEEEFDMGEDADVDSLMGDEDEPEEVDAEVEGEDDDEFDEQFAKVLSSMRKPKAKK